MLFRTDTILKEFTNHLQDDLILDFTVSDLTVTLLPPYAGLQIPCNAICNPGIEHLKKIFFSNLLYLL